MLGQEVECCTHTHSKTMLTSTIYRALDQYIQLREATPTLSVREAPGPCLRHLLTPSTPSYYGVNSTPLGSNEIEEGGWNAGLYSLAPGSEVSSYFNKIMQERFLPSSRVKFFAEHKHLGDRKFRSIKTGKIYKAAARCCIVDATYSRTETPSMRPPPYQVDAGVDIVTPNGLPDKFQSGAFENFTVVGAGKTGIDACLWLLENKANVDRITWIMPRDNYFFNRECFQVLCPKLDAIPSF